MRPDVIVFDAEADNDPSAEAVDDLGRAASPQFHPNRCTRNPEAVPKSFSDRTFRF